MIDVGAASFGHLSHSRHGIVAARYRHVCAERFGQRALVGAARDTDDRCAPRLGELHVQLPGDAEAKDDDELAGEDVDLPLRVKTGREDLDQRGDSSFDRRWQRKGVAWWNGDVLGKPAVTVASNEHAVRAEMCLTDPAVKARPAIELRIDDDAVAGAQRTRACIDHLARHLVTHDARILDRNGAVEDLVVGAADPAVRHAHEQLALLGPWPRHIVPDQFPGRRQHHRFHRCARASG